MQVLLISLFYFPEPVAKPHDFAIELTHLGHQVTVITGLPNYPRGQIFPGYRNRLWHWEDLDGVRILRVPHIIDRSHSAFRRIASYVSFSIMALVAGLFWVERPDIIWTYQIGLPGVLLAFLRRSRLVHEVQDLWPDWGQSADLGLKSWLFKILDAQERFIYRHAKAVTTISDGFQRTLVSKGVDANKITILPNWANETNFHPAERNAELAHREGFAGHFNVVYGGNIGTAQALDVIVAAAAILKDCPEIQFVMIGDGVERKRLEALTVEDGLTNVRFLGSRPPEQMASYYAMADVLLLHLKKDPQIQITIPSKTYAYLASGKPILAAAAGDVADLIVETGSGIVCPPEDPRALAQAVRFLVQQPEEERQKMGDAGRQAFLSRFTRQVLVKKYDQLFHSLLPSL